MRLFKPYGFLELPDAVLRAAEVWAGDRFRESTLSDSEADLLQRHNSAVAQIVNRRRVDHLLSLKSDYETGDAQSENALSPFRDDTFSAVAEETVEIKSIKSREAARISLLKETWHGIRNLLYFGTLPGYVSLEDGHTIESPQHVWGAPAQDDAHIHGIVRFPWEQQNIIGRGRIREVELDAVLDGVPARPVADPTPAPAGQEKKPAGGPPTKFDGESFLIDAFVLLYEKGLRPKTQSELRKAALEVYGSTLNPNELDPPSDEWAKPKIRALWHRLRLGDDR